MKKTRNMKSCTALVSGVFMTLFSAGVYADNAPSNFSPAAASSMNTPASSPINTSNASNALPVGPAGVVGSYELLHLKAVVSNSQNCAPLFEALIQATEKPLILEFSPKPSSKNMSFSVTDQGGKLTSYNYSIILQQVNGPYVHRVGAGSFVLNQQAVNYVIDISGDTSQPDFRYAYPTILSADHGHCTYVGLVEPDDQTIRIFKRNIDSGLVEKKVDFSPSRAAGS